MVSLFIALAVLAIIVTGLFGKMGAFFTVHTQTADIIERLGRYHKTAHAGFNVKIPYIDQKVATVNLALQQLNVVVDTKTRDNVFVRIPVDVQYNVIPGREQDAHYKLDDHEEQMRSYVRDNVRSTLATMTLDQAFESKNDIAMGVEHALQDKMGEFGYNIQNTLVTDIAPGAEMAEAMNKEQISERLKRAAITEAEGRKQALILNAEGEAEARRLSGMGVANERKEIAKGLAEQVENLSRETGSNEAVAILMSTQYTDMMRAIGASNNAKVVFVQSSPDAGNDLTETFRKAILETKNV